jgi:hypothetical protein
LSETLKERMFRLCRVDNNAHEHHFHGPGFVRVGVGDCQCGYNFHGHLIKHFGEEAVKHHRHSFTCCKCHHKEEHSLPFGVPMTDECHERWKAYEDYCDTLPPLGG